MYCPGPGVTYCKQFHHYLIHSTSKYFCCYKILLTMKGMERYFCSAMHYTDHVDSGQMHFQDKSIRRVERVLGFFSRPPPLCPPPPPLVPPPTRRRWSVHPPPFGSGGRDTLACGRGDGGVPIRTKEQTLWYSRYGIYRTYLLCGGIPDPRSYTEQIRRCKF